MRFEKRELQSLVEENLATFDKLKEAAQVLKTRIEDFANDREIFAGQAAEAVGGYLIETHVQVLGKWIACFEAIKTKLVNFLQDIEAIDSGYDFVIETAYVEDIVKELRKNRDAFAEIDQEAKDFVRQYHEFLDHDAPSMDRLLEALDDGIDTAERVLIEIDAVDYKYKNLNDEVEYLLYEIEKVCKGNNFLQIDPNIGILNYSLKDLPDNFKVRDMPVKRETDAPLKISDYDGNIDFEKVQTMLQRDDLSDSEMDYLVQLIIDEKVKYEDIIDCFKYDDFDKGKAENLKGNAYYLSVLVFEEMWEQTIAMHNGDLVNSDDQQKKLYKIMYKGQLLNIIGASEIKDIRFDLENAPFNGKEATELHRYKFACFVDPDFNPILGDHQFEYGVLFFRKKYDFSTDISIVTNYGSSELHNTLSKKIRKLREQDGWEDIPLDMLLKVLELEGIPESKLIMLARFLIKGYSYGKDIIKIQDGAIWWNDDLLTPAQISYKNMLTADIIGLLGGRFTYYYEGDNFVITSFSLETANALIILAGLKTLKPPVSEDEAFVILANENDPRFKEVYNYITQDASYIKDNQQKFTARLSAIYENNFDTLKKAYPNIEKGIPINQLPLDVLRFLIKEESSNREKDN